MMYNNRIFLASFCFCWSAAAALQANLPQEPQSLTDTICTGRPRSSCEVELDVPAACATDGPNDPSCPIVFFLHGSGGRNDGFSRNSGVHDANMIGVYPQGESGWNTGPKNSNNCHWSDYSCTTDPDEGDFIAHIIAEIRSMGGTGNIYAKGNSNGELKYLSVSGILPQTYLVYALQDLTLFQSIVTCTTFRGGTCSSFSFQWRR